MQKITKSIVYLFLLNSIISCNSQVNKKDYLGEWLEVKQQKNEFVIIKCGYEGKKSVSIVAVLFLYKIQFCMF